jgi:signal transduction histidine kinase
VGTALYRIVQEALTNALEHGDGTADLHVEAVGGTVRLRVENPVANPARRGGGPRRPSGGHGLVGMRERAVATGGTFGTTTGEGRFTVTAELPVGAGAR